VPVNTWNVFAGQPAIMAPLTRSSRASASAWMNSAAAGN